MITFDGDNLLIIITAVGIYDAEQELYSDWKEWFKTGSNAKYPLAFDTTGGDPVDASTDLSGFFFLRNDLGWRIKMPEANGQVIINGDLFPRDSAIDMFEASDGSFNVFLRQVVSSKSLVSSALGKDIWEHDISGITGDDQAGKVLKDAKKEAALAAGLSA